MRVKVQCSESGIVNLTIPGIVGGVHHVFLTYVGLGASGDWIELIAVDYGGDNLTVQCEPNRFFNYLVIQGK